MNCSLGGLDPSHLEHIVNQLASQATFWPFDSWGHAPKPWRRAARRPVSQPLMMRVCGTSRCMFRMQPHQSSNRSGGLPKESAIAEQLMEYVLRDVIMVACSAYRWERGLSSSGTKTPIHGGCRLPAHLAQCVASRRRLRYRSDSGRSTNIEWTALRARSLREHVGSC